MRVRVRVRVRVVMLGLRVVRVVCGGKLDGALLLAPRDTPVRVQDGVLLR